MDHRQPDAVEGDDGRQQDRVGVRRPEPDDEVADDRQGDHPAAVLDDVGRDRVVGADADQRVGADADDQGEDQQEQLGAASLARDEGADEPVLGARAWLMARPPCWSDRRRSLRSRSSARRRSTPRPSGASSVLGVGLGRRRRGARAACRCRAACRRALGALAVVPGLPAGFVVVCAALALAALALAALALLELLDAAAWAAQASAISLSWATMPRASSRSSAARPFDDLLAPVVGELGQQQRVGLVDVVHVDEWQVGLDALEDRDLVAARGDVVLLLSPVVGELGRARRSRRVRRARLMPRYSHRNRRGSRGA